MHWDIHYIGRYDVTAIHVAAPASMTSPPIILQSAVCYEVAPPMRSRNTQGCHGNQAQPISAFLDKRHQVLCDATDRHPPTYE